MAFEAVDFSEKAVFTGSAPCFSPDKKHVALSQEYRLVVRDNETMAVVGLFSCLDAIEAISWSPCGELILCGMYKRGTVQVFSINDPEWSCSITEGLAGICNALWAPSGEHILLCADFQVKISVWSLVDQSCNTLPPAKHSEAGIAFSPDGAALAVLERLECKDWLAIYETESWKLVTHAPLPTTDAADLAWSPTGTSIAVWDSPAQGPLVAVVDPSGEVLTTQRGATYGLGFKSVAWSPSGELLALGSYEQELTIANNVTWSSLSSFNHSNAVNGPVSVIIYQEENGKKSAAAAVLESPKNKNAASPRPPPSPPKSDRGSPTKRSTKLPPLAIPDPSSRCDSPTKGPLSSRATPRDPSNLNSATGGRIKSPRKAPLDSSSRGSRLAAVSLADQLNNPSSLLGEDIDVSTSRYVISELPVKLPAVRPPTDKPNPKSGIGLSSWSHDGAFLATRCDDRPNIMWIWDSQKLELASVIVQLQPIRSIAWAPSGDLHRLVIACGSDKIYFWTPDGASCVKVPVEGMKTATLKWCGDGGSLLVASKDGTAVLAYMASSLAGLAA